MDHIENEILLDPLTKQSGQADNQIIGTVLLHPLFKEPTISPVCSALVFIQRGTFIPFKNRINTDSGNQNQFLRVNSLNVLNCLLYILQILFWKMVGGEHLRPDAGIHQQIGGSSKGISNILTVVLGVKRMG